MVRPLLTRMLLRTSVGALGGSGGAEPAGLVLGRADEEVLEFAEAAVRQSSSLPLQPSP